MSLESTTIKWKKWSQVLGAQQMYIEEFSPLFRGNGCIIQKDKILVENREERRMLAAGRQA